MIPEKYSELEARENLPFLKICLFNFDCRQEKRKKTKKRYQAKTIFHMKAD